MLNLSPETEALIRARARASGKSPEQYLSDLVNGATPTKSRAPDVARMREIANRAAARPIHDRRSEKEITDEGWGF